MKHFIKFTARWADLDSNGHMRHSAYNDYGAHCRFQLFVDHGYGMDWLVKHDMGPVLFREETRFFKELNSGDEVTVDVRLLMVTSDGAKWTFTHRFLKSDGTLAATIVVDGAWMSLSRRKIVVPPETLRNHIQDLEKEPEFKLIPREKKD